MNTLKKFLSLALLTTSLYAPTHTQSDFESDEFTDSALEDFVQEGKEAWSHAKRSTLTSMEALDFIIQATAAEGIDLYAVLQQQLFLRTHRLNTRNILDHPFFVTYEFPCEPKTFTAQLFYTTTNNMRYYEREKHIESYLDVNNTVIIKTIKDILDENEINTVNLDDLLPLISKFQIQERKTGLMFQYFHQWQCAHFKLLFPFYYAERNFFLEQEDEDELRTIFAAFLTPDSNGPAASTSSEDEDQFAYDHLVSDRVGFGDLRLSYGADICRYEKSRIMIGGFATLPVGFSVKRGVIGSHFCPVTKRPALDLVNLIDLAAQLSGATTPAEKAALTQEINDILQPLGLGALDNLSAMLLEQQLGNNRHLGIGFFLKSQSLLSAFIGGWVCDLIHLRSRASIEYLFPAKEKRFFIQKGAPLELSQAILIEGQPEECAAASLATLENIFIDKFYAYNYATNVHPGIILRYSSSISYEPGCWLFRLGTDYWYQTAEHIDTAFSGQKNLNCKIAERPFAFQGQTSVEIGRTYSKETHDLYISLKAAAGGSPFFGLIKSKGIGDDYSVALNFERRF